MNIPAHYPQSKVEVQAMLALVFSRLACWYELQSDEDRAALKKQGVKWMRRHFGDFDDCGYDFYMPAWQYMESLVRDKEELGIVFEHPRVLQMSHYLRTGEWLT